jgi:hypothetical protein
MFSAWALAFDGWVLRRLQIGVGREQQIVQLQFDQARSWLVFLGFGV